jgi:hypothetical protein
MAVHGHRIDAGSFSRSTNMPSTTRKSTPRKNSTTKKSKTGEALRKEVLGNIAKLGKSDGRKAKEKKARKVSALDAAAAVLASSREPMNAQSLIKAMADKGLWTSPGGKTPHATLYAAMIREINEKGKEARFAKVERGLFAAKK